MLHDFFEWLQSVPGAVDGDPSTSWSQQLQSSLHQWSLLEGTHVVTLMLFAGTILFVDLRMLGLIFREVSFRTMNDKVLPLTIAGFALMMVTGLLLFLANPVDYYHSVWFRLKVIFLVIASANIAWFHASLKRHGAAWDASAGPPAQMKAAAVISLASWVLVILFGRLIAYTWFDCDHLAPGGFGYGFAECASLYEGLEQEAAPEEPAAEETAPDEPSGDGPPPSDAPPAEGGQP